MISDKSESISDKSFQTGIEILRRYCCFQERTIADVRLKAKKSGMNTAQIEKALRLLKEEDYLNEQRYAYSFVSGKLRHNKWGRIKIKAEMKLKKIDIETIESALQRIDPQDYHEVLYTAIEKKALILRQKKDGDVRAKLIRYALSKGFEYELIFSVMKEILKK